MITFFIVSIVLFTLFAFFDWSELATLALIAVIFTGVASCSNSDWYKKEEVRRVAQEKAEATPHVIREYDGCKVYAFRTDREHYFTRCGDSVSTETTGTKSCGKACSRPTSEVITTKENK